MQELRRLAQEAADSAWESYEHDRWSDTRDSIYDVLHYIKKNIDRIPLELQEKLLQCAEEGYSGIRDYSLYSSRALKAMHFMTKICTIIDEYYSQNNPPESIVPAVPIEVDSSRGDNAGRTIDIQGFQLTNSGKDIERKIP